MKATIAALAAVLIAGPALAQATPPAAPSPASPPASTTDSQTAPASTTRDGGRPGRGAYIKMEAPGGAEITVRCADGESTRACADIVMQLIERARSASSERRRDWDRDRDSRGDEMRGYRGERNRDF